MPSIVRQTKRTDHSSVIRRDETLELFEPILDEDEPRRPRFRCTIVEHDEMPAIGHHVVVAASTTGAITAGMEMSLEKNARLSELGSGGMGEVYKVSGNTQKRPLKNTSKPATQGSWRLSIRHQV